MSNVKLFYLTLLKMYFSGVNNLEGKGSLRNTYERADSENSLSELKHFLENFNVRTVLTAHQPNFIRVLCWELLLVNQCNS